jgi:hypothetical protein
VLGALGVSKFSQSKAGEQTAVAADVKISQIKKAVNSQQIIAKPKIRKTVNSVSNSALSSLPEIEFDLDEAVEQRKDDNEYIDDGFPVADQKNNYVFVEQKPMEFFGCAANQRRVCFLVDCSGSMKPVFSRVKTKLKDSISMLRPDQYFNIIFFGNEELYEFSSAQFSRATGNAKQRASKFIDSITPSGQTNAAAALKRAVTISSHSKLPSVIYFLTDAFELDNAGQLQMLDDLKGLLEKEKQGIVINTIGFWSRQEDKRILETISKWTGGEHVFINDFNM